jgi:quinate/shikimate dehydrogenase (NAD+)
LSHVPLDTSDRFLVGLVGSGLEPSFSPALHEREADCLGLRYLYQRIDLDDLGLDAPSAGALLGEAMRMGFRGVNVTHPCKQTILPRLDRLAPSARALGAVNTVVFEGTGEMVGHNTDVLGFEASFARGLDGAARDRVVLVGAGGAGAAVARAALAQRVGTLVVSEIDPDRARAVCEGLAREAGGRVRWCPTARMAEEILAADGVIHATPTGMAGTPGVPFDVDVLRPRQWVADVVYRPLETELLKAARARGCRTLDGGGMAVFQAAESFRIFTGRAPDVERMLRHFTELACRGDE